MYPFSFDGTKSPKILKSIKVVDNLHVKLQYNGKPLPLSQWFVQGHNLTVKKEVFRELPSVYTKYHHPLLQ